MFKFWTTIAVIFSILLLATVFYNPSFSAFSFDRKEIPAMAGKKVVQNIGTYVTNLSLSEGKAVKMSLSIELVDNNCAESANKKIVAVRDSINTVLSSCKYDDLKSPIGQLAVKDELMRQLNRILGEQAVTNVFITDMLIN